MKDYEIRVMTSDVGDGGTDADIFIVLKGGLSISTPLLLNTSKDDFERGSISTFAITVDGNVGNLNAVQIISNEAEGVWYPDSVIVSEMKNNVRGRSWLFFFPNGWFTNNGGAGLTLLAEPCHTGSD